MATTGKQILTSITLRNNTLENLENSQKILLKGEVAFGSLSGDYADQYIMKVGTGDKTWSQLSSFNIRIPLEQINGLSAQIAKQIEENDKDTQYQIVEDTLKTGENGKSFKLRKRTNDESSWTDVPASRFNIPEYNHQPIFDEFDQIRNEMVNLSARIKNDYTSLLGNSNEYVDQVSAWLSADYGHYNWLTRESCILISNQISAFTKMKLDEYLDTLNQISSDLSNTNIDMANLSVRLRDDYTGLVNSSNEYVDQVSAWLSADYEHYNWLTRESCILISNQISAYTRMKLEEYLNTMNQISTDLSTDYMNRISGFIDYMNQISTVLSTDYQDQIDTLSIRFYNRINKTMERMGEISVQLSTDYQGQIDDLTDYVNDISTYLSTDYQGQIDDLTDYVNDLADDLSTDYGDKFSNLTDYVEDLADDLSTDYNDKFSDLTDYVNDISSDLSTDYQGQIDNLTDYINDISTDLSTDYQDQIDDLYSKVGHAVHYRGNTLSSLSTGSTLIPRDIYDEGKTPTEGDIVISNKNEYIWGKNTAYSEDPVWTQMGDESSFSTHEEVKEKFDNAISATENTVEVYYNENELSNLGTNTGDIAIIKDYVYSNTSGVRQYQHRAYVWNADVTPKRWEAMDGTYSADKVYFKEDFKLAGDYTSIGNIKISEGTVEATGKSVKQLFDQMFKATIAPDYGDDPYVTASITDESTTKEVGTLYTPSWSCSFTPGRYTHPWDKTTISDGTTLSAFHITDSLKKNTVESTTSTDGSFDQFTLSDDNEYYITVYARYYDGDIAKNNMDENTSIQRTSSVTESKNSGKVRARRLYFWGYRKTGEDILDVNHLTSSDIRSFMSRDDNGGRKCYGFSFPSTTSDAKVTNFSVPNGTRQIIFAAPHDAVKKSIDVYNNTSLGGGLSFDNNNERVQNAVDVYGANSYKTAKYDIWYRNFTSELDASDLAIAWS